jgi:hypothetical protein
MTITIPPPAACQVAAGHLAAATGLTDDVAAAPFGCPTAGLPEDVAAALSSPGLSAVLAERIRQIEEFGHTRDADGALPVARFAFRFERMALDTNARLKTDPPRFVARRRLVKLAAFILAMIDRLDMESPSKEQAQ